jgi:hypothetical protein
MNLELAVNGLILINELLQNAELARQRTMRVITLARFQNREPTSDEVKDILKDLKLLIAQWDTMMPAE